VQDPNLRKIRGKIARAMIGQTVDLLADASTITHGVVSEVLVEAGTPKVVVDGARYNLSQVLTVTPPRLNTQFH
jgi:hypothetical protein